MENNNTAERAAEIIRMAESLMNDSIGDLKGANKDLVEKAIKKVKVQFKGVHNADQAFKDLEKRIK